MIRAALLLCLAFTGCAGFRARVQTATARAVAPADPATPAKIDEAALPIPAGSAVQIRRETETPAPTAADPTPASRTVETVTVTPAKDTRLTLAHAESGTQRAPDVRTELRRIDNAARAPLLYAALGAFALAVAGVYFRYPTPAVLCGLAGGGFLAAWKIADLPAWLWTVAAAAVVAAVALYFGHERGEVHALNQAGTVAK
jgi:hypothetical protein